MRPATGALPYAGTDPRSVTADLYSPYVDLNNIAGAEATFTGTATPGVPLAISFTDANSQRDEKDVYRAVNDIHSFFQTLAPEFAYANQRITANVSRGSTCNAYWDGTINFYVAGDGCANTGQIMDVVHHEFGHGVQNAILGSQGSEGLGEGNGDILGNLMTMSPIVGRGFYLNNCTTGIRNSQNSLRYPQDVVGQADPQRRAGHCRLPMGRDAGDGRRTRSRGRPARRGPSLALRPGAAASDDPARPGVGHVRRRTTTTAT